MHDFDFHNPTKILFGRGKEQQVGIELKSAGIGKVLLVSGQGSVQKSGLYNRVSKYLEESGIEYVEFEGVMSNPVLSHVRKGVDLAKEKQVDGVLAVGGGSVLDESKAIAVGALADEDVWSYFIGKTVEKALPVFSILTLAATGSEMNGNAVVTNEETKQKYNISSPHVYPKVSILNPELTLTVPLDYTAYGAVDIVAHVIEGYFTKESAGPKLQDRFVENIIRTTITTTNILMIEPKNYNARAEFMWAATLALNGLPTVGIGPYSFPNHMIEHSLSALYSIAHGAGLAIVIPAWMRWYAPRNQKQFERFANRIFGLNDANEGIEALEQWFEDINAPTKLQKAAISPDDIGMIAENAHGLAKQWGIEGTYTKEVITEILQMAT